MMPIKLLDAWLSNIDAFSMVISTKCLPVVKDSSDMLLIVKTLLTVFKVFFSSTQFKESSNRLKEFI